MIVDENGMCTLDEEDMSYHTNPKADYKYYPDGDRVMYDPDFCDGYCCPVDCYHCVVAQKILEHEDESEEDTTDAG